MRGNKAQFLANYAQKHSLDFLRFDFSGHGKMADQFDQSRISHWLQDAIDMLDQQTSKPTIIVGSSMGAWIGCLLLRARPGRIASFLGIAAAPDFIDEIAPRPDDMALLKKSAFIEDAQKYRIFDQPLQITIPFDLIHGDQDEVVPLSLAQKLLQHVQSPKKNLTIIPRGDHRLSQAEHLAVIAARLDALCQIK